MGREREGEKYGLVVGALKNDFGGGGGELKRRFVILRKKEAGNLCCHASNQQLLQDCYFRYVI